MALQSISTTHEWVAENPLGRGDLAYHLGEKQSATQALDSKTPYEMLYGKKSDLANLPEWGSAGCTTQPAQSLMGGIRPRHQ